MLVKQFRMGGDRNFGYLVADEKSNEAMVVDPSYTPEQILDWAKENDLTIKYIFNTHRHHDHSNGNAVVEKGTGKAVLAYGDNDPVNEKDVTDGATLPLGNLEIKILYTPGHTTDSMCILVADALFTGDTLFVGKVGGTGFGDDARTEYDSLHNKLMKLPDNTRVFPGHDVGVQPESTIGYEKESNPFLIQPDYDSFLDLKKNWLAYKEKHGIA